MRGGPLPDQFISVSTMIKGRFRLLKDADSPLLCTGIAHAGSAALREEALLSSRQNDIVLRFLIDMDHKLDAIMGLLQRDSLLAGFPGEGRIVELGGSGLVFECGQSLHAGQYLELLLLLEELPLRLVSVRARVESLLPDRVLTGQDSAAYDITYTCMREEDREAVIRFVFSEQRRIIRQQKSGEEA